ncbi:MAG: hypothetical protein U5N85_18570 [Arcicella sp.]|nr:hypothetical protein [Arcicella sp.]
MLRSNSFQVIIPKSKCSAILPTGTSIAHAISQISTEGRFVVVVGEDRDSYVPDYHGFKACFDFKNQENIRVWQMPS